MTIQKPNRNSKMKCVQNVKHLSVPEIVQRKFGHTIFLKDVVQIIEADLGLEMTAMSDLRETIAICEEVGDYVSRDLARSILDSEEEHVDWLETQRGLIEKMGLENYIQSQTSK